MQMKYMWVSALCFLITNNEDTVQKLGQCIADKGKLYKFPVV